MGKLRSTVSGSDFRYVSKYSSIPTISIGYTSRVTATADSLGPCRQMRVSVPYTFEQEDMGTGASCYEIFSPRTRGRTELVSVEAELVDGMYSLDFGMEEKVVSSVKNYQLKRGETGNTNVIVFEFFKIGKSDYKIKYKAPLTEIDIFCLGISSVERKLCTQ